MIQTKTLKTESATMYRKIGEKITLCSDPEHLINDIMVSVAGIGGGSLFLICDENTHTFCLPYLSFILQKKPEMAVFLIPAGEQGKTHESMWNVLNRLSELKAGRSSLLINLGGGVVSDLGGFAASVFKRGIPYINVPTTLLAMVDAAIGGKTGINLGHIKNQIGTFHFPEAVLIWPGFLKTLPEKEWRSGKGELFKYSLLGAGFSPQEITTENDSAGMIHLIRQSAAFKQNIVAMDPNDKGIRMILNFGHTIGHALESEALRRNIPLTHGEAVAAGIIAEIFLLNQQGITTDIPMEETMNVYRRLFDPTPVRQILDGDPAVWILHDKKSAGKAISLPVIPLRGNSFQTIALQTEKIETGFTFLKNQL